MRYTGGEDLVYPVLETTATDIMDNVDYIYDSSALTTGFEQWFEVGFGKCQQPQHFVNWINRTLIYHQCHYCEWSNVYAWISQIGLLHWLYDGFQINETTEQAVLGEQYAFYNPLIGVSEEDYTITYDDTNGEQNYSKTSQKTTVHILVWNHWNRPLWTTL